MKKIIILFVAILVHTHGFAQRIGTISAQPVNVVDQYGLLPSGNAHWKTTATGDTLTLKHITGTDTLAIYKVGPQDGYVTGTNKWGDKAFAERYDYHDDTGKNMQVIGVFAMFSGKVNPASGKSVTLKIWTEGSRRMITGTRYYRGFPATVVDSLTVPVTQIGIGLSTDTLKKYLFATPTTDYFTSFFAGYSIDYYFPALNGDTIGLVSSRNGNGTAPSYVLDYHVSDFGDTTLDTTYIVPNATLESDNVWHDNYTDNDSILNNLAIYPIIIMGKPAGVKGITRNNLTFYGCFPNPASENTSVKFALATGADVTLTVMDMDGRIISTMVQAGLQAGEHIIPVNMAGIPAGEYLYLLRTSAGDGMAGKLIRTF